MPFEIDILESQPTDFQQPHAGPVIQLRHQPNLAAFRTLFENPPDFRDRQDGWQSIGLLGADSIDVARINFQDLLVEKQDRRKRLILSTRRHFGLDRQVRQKFFDLRAPEF